MVRYSKGKAGERKKEEHYIRTVNSVCGHNCRSRLCIFSKKAVGAVGEKGPVGLCVRGHGCGICVVFADSGDGYGC